MDVRVWQRERDARSIYISARPVGGSWATLGTIPLALDDGYSGTRAYRYGDITVGVTTATISTICRQAKIVVRVWQDESNSSVVHLSACVRGEWRRQGPVEMQQPVTFDDVEVRLFRYSYYRFGIRVTSWNSTWTGVVNIDTVSASGRWRYGDLSIGLTRGWKRPTPTPERPTPTPTPSPTATPTPTVCEWTDANIPRANAPAPAVASACLFGYGCYTAFHIGGGVWLTAGHGSEGAGPQVGTTFQLHRNVPPYGAAPPFHATIVESIYERLAGNDLAVLQTRSGHGWPRYTLADADSPTPDAALRYAVHHAGGAQAHAVTQLEAAEFSAGPYARASGRTGPGASGAPVLNSCGLVDGMVLGYDRDDNTVFLTAERIRALLGEWDYDLAALAATTATPTPIPTPVPTPHPAPSGGDGGSAPPIAAPTATPTPSRAGELAAAELALLQNQIQRMAALNADYDRMAQSLALQKALAFDAFESALAAWLNCIAAADFTERDEECDAMNSQMRQSAATHDQIFRAIEVLSAQQAAAQEALAAVFLEEMAALRNQYQ